MTAPAPKPRTPLTEREKQTLRLIVRGHDAKSVARHLDLSVHTINERLRDARRKMAVSSSREAARMLFEQEGDTPETPVPAQIGEAVDAPTAQTVATPEGRGMRSLIPTGIAIGVSLMTLALAVLLLTAPAQQAPAPTAVPYTAATTAVVEASARQWLTLLDQGRWDDSWSATGASFRKLNTRQVWAKASDKVRAPLGAMVSRTLLSHENLPAPPAGYEVVKFRTSFANKADAIETVTLDYEGGAWRVVGVYVS